MTTWTRELSTGSTSTASTPLTVGNLKLDGNTISTEDSNGSMTFDTNGTGKYIFNHDGGGAQAIHIVCSDSDGGFLHFMNSTTGSTGDTDGWKMGMDASEHFSIYNEEINSTAMYINGANNNVKFFGDTANDTPCQVTIGDDGETEGHLILARKDADEFPHIKMFSSNGTASYLFVADNGTLRIHNSAPTSNSDGSAV